MIMARKVMMLIAVSMLAGCGVKQSVSDAEAQISTFHADISSGRFDDIWTETSQDLRQATSKDDFLNLMKAIHKKLGPVKKRRMLAGMRTPRPAELSSPCRWRRNLLEEAGRSNSSIANPESNWNSADTTSTHATCFSINNNGSAGERGLTRIMLPHAHSGSG